MRSYAWLDHGTFFEISAGKSSSFHTPTEGRFVCARYQLRKDAYSSGSLVFSVEGSCLCLQSEQKTLKSLLTIFDMKFQTECRSSITLIVSPLSVLMDEFHQKITNWRLKSFIVADNQDLVQEIRAAAGMTLLATVGNMIHYETTMYLTYFADDPIKCAIYLLCSPEVLQKQCIRRLLGAISIDFIMVDECHTAVSW